MGQKPLNQKDAVRTDNPSSAELVADIIAFVDAQEITAFCELADTLAASVNIYNMNMRDNNKKKAEHYFIFGRDPELYLNAFLKNSQFFQAYFSSLNNELFGDDEDDGEDEDFCPCCDDEIPPFEDSEDEYEGEDYIGQYADDDIVKEINLQNYVKKLKEEAKALFGQVEDINKEVAELSSKIVAGKRPETAEELAIRAKHSSLIEFGLQKQELARKIVEIAYDLANIVYNVPKENQ